MARPKDNQIEEAQDMDSARPNPTDSSDDVTAVRAPRILIAEDDEEMAALLAGGFSKAGYVTIVCNNGWDLLQFSGFGGKPQQDLIVSDIRLPGISGLDALRAFHYAGGFTPTILITAFGDEWTHSKSELLGAVDMFDKPFDIDDLVARVRELVPPGGSSPATVPPATEES
jgi:DNA-binding response OmpR family regulator